MRIVFDHVKVALDPKLTPSPSALHAPREVLRVKGLEGKWGKEEERMEPDCTQG